MNKSNSEGTDTHTMKYAYLMIVLLCVWLFATVFIEFNRLLSIPTPVYALLLAVMITAAHMLYSRRYGKPKAQPDDTKSVLKVIAISIACLTLTVVLVLVASAMVNPESRAELSAPFITCKRDESQIKATKINRELMVYGGKITIHSIISNVPQSSENPQAYSYECQKAVLMEITIESSSEALNIRDLEIVSTSEAKGISADELNSSSQFTAYARTKHLEALRQGGLDESGDGRGWIAFPMPESEAAEIRGIVYDSGRENTSINLW